MKEKLDVTVIIPVYKLDENRKALITNSIKSVETQLTLPNELLLVVGKDDTDSLEYVRSFDFNALTTQGIIVNILENNAETDFCSQFNLGVDNAVSEYVSLLEQDDELSMIILKNAKEYIKSYPEVGVFLPLIIDVNQAEQFLSMTNEAVWANQFSDELGYLDLASLLTYQNFNIDGMIIKKTTYKDNGGLKPKIVLTFIYEFLLRLTHFDVKIMSI